MSEIIWFYNKTNNPVEGHFDVVEERGRNCCSNVPSTLERMEASVRMEGLLGVK